MDGTVLIADDDRTIRTVLTQALSRAGCRVHATGSLSQLSKWVEEGRGDLVITDVVMPDGNGIDRIPAIHKARPDLPVIVISAQNTIVTAIRATEVAAFEYLPKPFDLPDLMAKAREAMALRKRKYDAEPKADATTQGAADPVMPLIGHAPAMQALFRMVARVLNADLPVLIQGEAGVGKSTIARSIHELSTRSERELVLLTSADASDANPGKLADRLLGGTIIIEHPAGFDSAAQARLIGLFETLEAGSERAMPPRIVATAGSDPLADVSAGRLRSDLYYRLAGVTISVPPLRARVDDILPLANHLLARASVQGLPERELTAGAASLLRSYPFPGNIRELENMMRLLALTANDTEISEAEMREVLKRQGERAISLSAPYRNDADTGEGVSQGSIPPNERLSEVIEVYLQRYFDLHGEDLPPPGLYSRFLRELELPLLQVAMDATGGNQLKCADLLGVNRNTLRKKLNELNIDVTRRRKLM